MKDVLISCVAFFTTTEADDPDLRVLLPLPLAWWPFTVLLLEAVCLEPSFDALPTIFDNPFTSFDVEVAPLAVAAVSSLGLFSAGSDSVASVEASPLNFAFGREDVDDWSEAHADDAEAFSLDSGSNSVLRFLCV